MSDARILLCALLFGLVTPASFAIAQEANEPLAQPQPPINQTGFPDELYGWVTPPDNPQTPAKIALGKKLFFDKRLSSDNTQECANCHDPEKGFTDQLPTATGYITVRTTQRADRARRAVQYPAVLGRARPTLKDQAKLPIMNPVEMGMENRTR